jgi:hypothetical protein
MKTSCEACHTKYDYPEQQPGMASCPCCGHVNEPQGRVEALTPTPSPMSAPASAPEDTADGDQAPMKTMLFPAEGELSDTGVTDVERLQAQTKPGLKGVALGLTVIEQGSPPRRVPITQSRLTIGRGSCDLRVHDPEASREHCVIEVYDGVPTLKDLKSANGTLLNGQLVREHVLKDGDEITLGSTVVKIEFPKAA